MKISLNQKRFLIIWICFHSFALFVNVAMIYGTLREESEPFKDTFGNDFIKYFNHNLFTSGNFQEDFWPFTTYSQIESHYPGNYTRSDTHYFYGIFTSYGYLEYFSYLVLGFAIIYIPKIWGTQNEKS
jgi:hypothetical protein